MHFIVLFATIFLSIIFLSGLVRFLLGSFVSEEKIFSFSSWLTSGFKTGEASTARKRKDTLWCRKERKFRLKMNHSVFHTPIYSPLFIGPTQQLPVLWLNKTVTHTSTKIQFATTFSPYYLLMKPRFMILPKNFVINKTLFSSRKFTSINIFDVNFFQMLQTNASIMWHKFFLFSECILREFLI